MFAFVEFRRIGVLVFENVAREFDHRTLQTETDAEKWLRFRACPFDRGYFAFDAARTKATGHQHTLR